MVSGRRLAAVAGSICLAVGACGSPVDESSAGRSLVEATAPAVATPGRSAPPLTTAPPAAVSPTVAPTAAPTPRPDPTAAPTPRPDPTAAPTPIYRANVRAIDEVVRLRVEPTSWRPGCPVGLDELRLVELQYWGFDGIVHDGELIVHQDWAEAMVDVFAAIFDARFPIERIELVDNYEGNDQASMRANNTSAFNCREVAYRPGVWSNHAFGTAIDVNPLVNPYVDGDFVDPPEGAPFVDRSAAVTGLITAGDPVVSAFAAIGWTWGGDWTGAKDFQHFSANGR